MNHKSLRAMVEALNSSGMTYTEIARRCDAAVSSVIRWRDGEQRPSGEHLFALLDLADERRRALRKTLRMDGNVANTQREMR